MVQGFGSHLNKYNDVIGAVGSNNSPSYGNAPVAPVQMIKNANVSQLNSDTVDLSTQQQAPVGDDMFGSLKYTLPLWFVLGKGVDLYNNKCTGDYLNSLPAKLGRFGDRIAESKFANNSLFRTIGSKYTNLKEQTVGRWKSNSTILRNLMENSTKPEWDMAKSAMYTQEQELASEFGSLFEKYVQGGGKKPALKNLVPSKEEKEFVRRILGDSASEIDKVNCLQLRRSNPLKYNNEGAIKAVLSQRTVKPDIIKEILLKELGIDSATFAKYKADPTKYVKEIRELALKAGKDMKVYHGNYNIVGSVFRRQANMSQIGNKMLSIAKDAVDSTGKAIPPKTALGRGVSKTMQGLMRGLTFGGGKLGLLIFVAPALVDMYQNAKEAPDDQKAGTVAYGLAEALSWVITFPASMRLMHKIGGLRYLGMTPNQVELYRQALNKFNAENKAGKFVTKEAYHNAFEKVKALRQPSTKLNLGQKILKGLGFGITQDLEMRSSWKNPNLKGVKSLGNILRGKNIGNVLRNGVGIVGKFGLFFGIMGYVLSPLFTKPLEWIFGKPYDRNEEAAKKAEEAAKLAAQTQMTEISQPSMDASQGAASQVIDAVNNFNAQMEAQKSTPIVSSIPPREPALFVKSQNELVKDTATYIPAQNCGIPKDSDEFRNYMPAQDSQIPPTQENIEGLSIIEQRADKAVEQAYDLLRRRV